MSSEPAPVGDGEATGPPASPADPLTAALPPRPSLPGTPQLLHGGSPLGPLGDLVGSAVGTATGAASAAASAAEGMASSAAGALSGLAASGLGAATGLTSGAAGMVTSFGNASGIADIPGHIPAGRDSGHFGLDSLTQGMPRDISMSGASALGMTGGLTGILQGIQAAASAPPKHKALMALKGGEGSQTMRFDSGIGTPAEPMPSADSLSHYPSALNLQSMATGFGGPSATGGSFGGMVDKEATEPPIVQASAIKKLAKKATKGYRKVGVEKLPKSAADENFNGQEDLASEFGQLFYPHGFRKMDERVYDAIRRWFTYFESEEALRKRTEMKQFGRLGKKFMENMNETISRNIYEAFLHDLYAQRLRSTMNWIALPLIFINSVSSALGALSLAPMTPDMFLGITVTQIILGVIAAVLVAVQKFFQFAEKAAIHEAIKEAYFEAVSAETLLIYDLSVDEITGMVVSSNGQPLRGEEIKLRLDKLYKTEKRLEGTPDEPVPEAVAGQLQPFVSRLQKDGYNGRWNLVNFPPVLGLKSYFLDVPEMSGWCSIVKNGVVRCQLGHNCQPINHDMPMDGWTILCCGAPMFWSEGKNGRIRKTSARLTAENLERVAREKVEQFRQNVPKGIKRWRKKAFKKSRARPIGEGVEDDHDWVRAETAPSFSAGVGMGDAVGDVEQGGPVLRRFQTPGMAAEEAQEAYLEHLGQLDELEEEIDALEAAREGQSLPPEELEEYIHAHYEHWLEHGSLGPPGYNDSSSSDDEEEDAGEGAQGVQSQAAVGQGGHGAHKNAGGSGVPPAPPRPPAPSPPPPPPLTFSDGSYQPLSDGEAPTAPSPFRLLGPLSALRSPTPSAGGGGPAPVSRLTAPMISPSRLRAPMSSPVPQPHKARGFVGPGPVAEALEVSPFESGQQQQPEIEQPLLQQQHKASHEEEVGEEDEDSEEESVKPMSDVASEFGEAYYGPNFRLPGEKVKFAVVRYWRNHPDGTLAAYSARQDKRKTADKCKAFLRTITEAMSRNLYIAILHDLYAQRLKGRMNWISMPLIFMNSFSAVLASASLANLPAAVLSGMSLATTGINVVAAVLVAMQKFFMLAEKAALHDAIKKAHYEAYTELSTLMVELTVDPDTKVIMDTSGLPISNDVITKKLVEMANIEKKLEGTPDEPVPESIARQLQPYVSKLQDEGYDDRLALFRFPPVIGIRSYFMEVPEKTGLCSIVCDGVVSCQWGSSCKPINHEVTQVGCELLCCGDPCIVCASNESYEGKKAAEVFEQEPARPVNVNNPASPKPQGRALIDAPDQQASMRRSRELISLAQEPRDKRGSKELGSKGPGGLERERSKEIPAVRSNQVAPEPAAERPPAAREQELSQISTA